MRIALFIIAVVLSSLPELMGQELEVDSAGIDSIPVATEVENKGLSEELAFSSYLVSNDLYDEAELVLLKLEQSEDLSDIERDSINFLLGSLHYYRQEFIEAVTHFKAVNHAGILQLKGDFMRAMCEIEMNQLDSAKHTLESLNLESNSNLKEFKAFMLEGVALLRRDYAGFDSLRNASVYTNYMYRSEHANFEAYYDEMSKYKRKSPFLAGLISAIIPGLGKFYAGYRGLPFGTMFMTIPLAAMAVEGLIIGGLLSPPFLAFGAVFSVFYIGAIWGSVLSGNALEQEIYAQFDHNIRFDMHVPLRRIL